MKAYNLIKASEKYLNKLGYNFEPTNYYYFEDNDILLRKDETKKKSIDSFTDISYSVKVFDNVQNDIRIYCNFRLFGISYFDRRKGMIFEREIIDWQKFLVKELGQEYIDEMKKYYTEREKAIKEHYNHVITRTQEELNKELSDLEKEKKSLNIEDELSM